MTYIDTIDVPVKRTSHIRNLELKWDDIHVVPLEDSMDEKFVIKHIRFNDRPYYDIGFWRHANGTFTVDRKIHNKEMVATNWQVWGSGNYIRLIWTLQEWLEENFG